MALKKSSSVLINKIETIQSIFSPLIEAKVTDEIPQYLLMNLESHNWWDNFQDALNLINKPEQLLAITLLIKNNETINQIDSLFIVVKKNDITLDFISEISKYISPTIYDVVSILDFLKYNWSKRPESYPINFWLTTHLEKNKTVLSDLAVAPRYQGFGLMKSFLLKISDVLEKLYGEDHCITASTMHPATHLLFKPQDKLCRLYKMGTTQAITCSKLKLEHAITIDQRRLKKGTPSPLSELGFLNELSDANLRFNSETPSPTVFDEGLSLKKPSF